VPAVDRLQVLPRFIAVVHQHRLLGASQPCKLQHEHKKARVHAVDCLQVLPGCMAVVHQHRLLRASSTLTIQQRVYLLLTALQGLPGFMAVVPAQAAAGVSNLEHTDSACAC
jgi:hypothetical protein